MVTYTHDQIQQKSFCHVCVLKRNHCQNHGKHKKTTIHNLTTFFNTLFWNYRLKRNDCKKKMKKKKQGTG